ncbi:hypothetical protein KKC91_04270 [bacterium]|nr:hypothetical protein [bacterium]MBU1853262.1 hypothetical protein [Candidatus Omnitrophota bacterium]
MKKLFLSILILSIMFCSLAIAEELEREGPDGLKYVEQVLKYKGIRRHRIKKTNDAEQLFITAVELLKEGYYDNSMEYLKKAIRKDPIYLDAHFILASLYEREGDLESMEKEYRFFLKKSHVMRKWKEESFGLKDKEFEFIKRKFDYYNIPLKEPTSHYINTKYWVIGTLFILVVISIIFVLIRKSSDLF